MVRLPCLSAALIYSPPAGLFSEVSMNVIESLPLETLVVRVCLYYRPMLPVNFPPSNIGHKYNAAT